MSIYLFSFSLYLYVKYPNYTWYSMNTMWVSLKDYLSDTILLNLYMVKANYK